MDRTQHPTNNDVLGAPKGWDQSELPCSALPITRVIADRVEHVVSFWRPTPDELKKLANGALVELWVVGHNMPPVALAVDALEVA